MSAVEFDRVSKIFPGGTAAVRDFNLSIATGEFMVLVGPSGCGKSTVLRLLAGLEEISTGEIRIGGRVVNDLPAQERDIAMVFQNYALYPHKTVRQNLAFPLQMAGWSRDRIAKRVQEVARLLELEPLLDRKPGQLSGGQRQRVAMGRALVREPAVFLMDEPLSNLDAQLRGQMRREITALQRRLHITTLYVTHDQVEALTMGDRLAVFNQGVLQQVGTANEVYRQPVNLFVATFIGSPRMNLFEVVPAVMAGGAPGFRVGNETVPLPDRYTAGIGTGSAGQSDKLIVGIRPEAFGALAAGGTGLRLRARVTSVETMGHEQIVLLDAGTSGLGSEAMSSLAAAFLPGGPDTPAGVFAARMPSGIRAVPDEIMELTLDLAQVHVFDAQGNALPRGGS